MNFAFYGRVSTEDQQDPEASRGWQIARARQLVEPLAGVIVSEFFDIGLSRSLPWKRRPEAARLLEAFRDKSRGFDAVVIGEPARAFYGAQYELTFPLFEHYGIGLWVPDVPGGRVDPESEGYELMMSIFGTMGKSERRRIKVRVRAAMAAQAATDGRFLGGRPPYGYRLADVGPHPNPGKAAAGQRAHQLEIDPGTAPIVRRIFDEYLSGHGIYAIAEGLTRDGILSPSASDPARNRHRASSAGAWGKSAVRVILGNPRYTGRQVWNRQRRDEVLVSIDDVALGHETKMRWNNRADWIWSAKPAHEAIITPDTFAATHEHLTAGANRPVSRRPRSDAREPYALRGLLFCGLCGRRMQGSTAHGTLRYRCRYPAEYALTEKYKHPRQVYVNEQAIVHELDCWLASLFDTEHLDQTCEHLAAASAAPDDGDTARREIAQRKVANCDRRLSRYRAALDSGADPAVVTTWIAEAQGEKLAAQEVLDRSVRQSSTAAEIRDLIAGLTDVTQALKDASGEAKAELYTALGLRLTYRPNQRQVDVIAAPKVVDVSACRRGDLNPHALSGTRPST
jgi:site-specific DNA recombinase